MIQSRDFDKNLEIIIYTITIDSQRSGRNDLSKGAIQKRVESIYK
jgi:hypothetical protein